MKSRQAILRWLTVLGIAALIGVELAREVVTHSGLTQADPAVTRWIVDHRAGWLTFMASILTWLGSSFVIIPIGLALGAFLWFRRHDLMPLTRLAVAFLGAAAIYDIVKPAIGRARPAALLQVGGPDDGFAFPSGHATQSTAFYGMLAFVLIMWLIPRRRLLVATTAAFVVLLIGATRLYLGVHWLTDVLGGFAIGFAWLAVTVMAFTVFENHGWGKGGRTARG